MSGDAGRAWQLTLPCSRVEAEAIAAAAIDLPAVLMTSEVDEATGEWRLDAYFAGQPDGATVAAIRALTPSGGWSDAEPQPIGDEDWVTMSQAGLEPIREGRFVVHTAARPAEPPPGGRAFLIDAGLAFGTGHHETTAGCLAMLERLAADARVDRVVDVGTGTGLLAFAAKTLWPAATVVATDIDPVAIEVTRANAAANGIDGIETAVADGARGGAIAVSAPYDLIVANILAGPLVSMAPELAAIAEARAAIVLAGLLTAQADTVVAAFAACGCVERDREARGDWTILLLQAGAIRFVPTEPLDPEDRDGWALDL